MAKANKVLLAVIAGLLLCETVFGGDWPQWRGPFLNGSADEKNLPSKFSPREGVSWVSALPGPSSATPVISRGRVFITSTDAKNNDLVGLCFDANNGKQLWRKKLGTAEGKFKSNNMASPSPVTDGKNVCFLYGNGELVGVDPAGEILWSRNLVKEYGTLSLLFGYSSSPLLYNGKLYVIVLRRNKVENGRELDSFLLAIDPVTGKNLWKHQRPTDAEGEAFEAYSTPTVLKNNGRMEIGVVGGDYVTGHDPETGKEVWRYGYNPAKQTVWNTIPVLVQSPEVICASIGRGKHTIAIKTNAGDGLLSQDDVAWTFSEPSPDVCTPLYYNGHFYILEGRTKMTMSCLDPKTGQVKWQGKLGGKIPWRASPTGADYKIYCMSEAGEVAVIAADPGQFSIIHRVELSDKPAHASIAIADGHLFIRTATQLFCVGK
ncbi:MAG: hypothetical protein E4H40_00340 [Candidatus Brocadiia bacterium]|nr:MAG: hypothetical protein E4H40_00340 [Candidatus Brocadiia bacterium]